MRGSVKDLNDILGPVRRVWDDQPGGTVVREYEEDGVKYVTVVFKNSDTEYTYFKADNE